MLKLFYIEASPRKERSHSIEIDHIFLKSYREANPTDEVEVLDLWMVDFPTFDGQALHAKYAILNGLEHTPKQVEPWIAALADQFKPGTKYLSSASPSEILAFPIDRSLTLTSSPHLG